jgi:outer membrane murein-binding lipoprotein Lpp
MKQYEALLALYQAQNALQIAELAGAPTEASDTYARATALYEQARMLNSRKGQHRQVVTAAREAVQAAQDARAIAEKRQEQSREEAVIVTPDQ